MGPLAAPPRRWSDGCADPTAPRRWVQVSLAVVDDAAATAARVLIQAIDVTARREREERLQALAEREPLTNLWNRRRFEQELARQLAAAGATTSSATLVVLDVDCLKAGQRRRTATRRATR